MFLVALLSHRIDLQGYLLQLWPSTLINGRVIPINFMSLKSIRPFLKCEGPKLCMPFEGNPSSTDRSGTSLPPDSSASIATQTRLLAWQGGRPLKKVGKETMKICCDFLFGFWTC